MLLLIDNYDSFTFNLAHRLGELGAEVRVIRNDAITVPEIERMAPARLVISPGPGRPETAGVTVEALRHFSGRVPVLGVCLGHQALAVAFGGRVDRAVAPMHGKTSPVVHDGQGVFAGVVSPFDAGRYHSLVIARDAVPAGFRVTATVEADGTIMGIQHETAPTFGVQFHPESVLDSRWVSDPAQLPGGALTMFPALLEQLRRHEDLSIEQASAVMGEIMDGRAQPAQIAGLLMALALKGERPSEMVGFARAMRARATPLPSPVPGVFDTCGTGGDGAHTFNVSTAAAVVVAGAGVRVAKHGNRAVSSRAGSADVFEALGVNLDADVEPRASGARRGGTHVLLRAEVAPLDAARRADASGARRPYGVQPARPPDESGRRAPASRWRLAAGAHRTRGSHARRARDRARMGRARRGRSRRTLHAGPYEGLGASPRHGQHLLRASR